MRFIAGLVIALLFTIIFRVALRKVPAIFYIVATLLSALLIVDNYVSFPPSFREYFLFLLQSNTLAMGMFTIVMFIGVLDPQSKIRKMLMPIRAELSIVASLLTIGHVIKYGESYLGKLLFSAIPVAGVRVWATIIAVVLVILLVPLTVTSVKLIRKNMSQRSWQNLQRFAYLFYGLIFIHILFYLLPPALEGNSMSALISVCVYLVLGVLYAVLRIRLYARLKRRETSKAVVGGA